MTLEQNNAVQLWRKAEAATQDASNLFLSPMDDELEKIRAIQCKLREAMSAITYLEVKVRNHRG